MSLTTRIRFTEPIDPRVVWAKVLTMIDTPADYTWSNVPVGGNDIAWRNPLIYAEPHQGADIWAYVMYGPDGCRLVEDDDEVGYVPPAFIEVTLIGGWDSAGKHAMICDELAYWRVTNDSLHDVWTMDDTSNGWWPTESIRA